MISGIGSFPGTDAVEATRIILGELPDLPHLPELPARGPGADMIGRTLAMLPELGFDLQPAGWRLSGAGSLEQQRGARWLASDLDVLAELAGSRTGAFKLQIAGPWTLAANVERPRGGRLLADRGACRELAQALAEAAATHLADAARRMPNARFVLQVDEPGLPDVLGGGVPTASGLHQIGAIDPMVAAEGLVWTTSAAADAGATPIAHCCAAEVPVEVFTDAGFEGVSVDLAALSAAAWDPVGGLLDAGSQVYLGLVPAIQPETPIPDRSVAGRLDRFLSMLGLEVDVVGPQLVLTPSCGLAGATPTYARVALAQLRRVGEILATG